MNAIILSVGDELASGQTIDTNSAYLARRLAARGIRAVEHVTAPDDRRRIAEAIRRGAKDAELLVITGGLGPTDDDLTRQALADAMGVELVLDEPSLAAIEKFFRALSRPMADANRAQAMAPRGANVLPNRMGTAPGIHARVGAAEVYVMPGVPAEMEAMFEEAVLPRLPAGEGAIALRLVHCFGAGESDVGTKIADLMRRDANPLVGTTVAAGMVSIRIQGRAASEAEGSTLADRAVEEVRRRLGDLVVGQGEQTMASVLGGLLRGRGQTLATAESCTGGMIGAMLTAVGGASDYYRGGVVAYANDAKADLLDVPRPMLEAHGAVSEPVAAAMAEGCRERFRADWALSATGVAGPAGGSPQKPVGLVFLGLAGDEGTRVQRAVFPGTREAIRLRASLAAMNMLRLKLTD
jgi:nicotinamide-nucleotide amidase